jgi:predicted NUDIX family NTP pyrophosphohydrolase
VYAWAAEADVDPDKLKSNTFTMSFASGGTKEFPEVDRAGWFPVEEAKEKILDTQVRLVIQLAENLADRSTC